MIPYGRQLIDDDDIDAVIAALRSDYLTQGPRVPAFEQAVADKVGVRFAVAVNSATSGLHVACLALGVGPGDLVWTSAVSFVASANCAIYCGADVDFVDIDPRTYNMSPEALAAKLEEAEREGKLPKVVVPVHLAGQSCDMAAIRALGDRYGFAIVEDASHAIGGTYRDRPVGDCRFSDIAVFSFHPVKIITTAEGGIATTNDPALARAMDLARSHGVTRDPALMRGASEGPWYYQQLAIGFNYRLTDLHAALGLSQLARIDRFVERRRAIAAAYDRDLAGLPLVLPFQLPDADSSWHLYIVQLGEDADRSRRAVFDELRARGIGVNVHYIPIYLHPFYRDLGFAPGLCPEAEAYYERAISIPLHAGLDEADRKRVVDAIGAAVGQQ